MIASISFFYWLGVFPLLIFAFSLIKPTKFTKKILPPLIVLLVLLLLLRIGWKVPDLFAGVKHVVLAMFIVIPPLTAWLMTLSGTSALAYRCSPWLGIPLTIMDAIGCMGLIVGIWMVYFYPIIFAGHGIDDVLVYIKIGGGIGSLFTLVYAAILWMKRMEDIRTGEDV